MIRTRRSPIGILSAARRPRINLRFVVVTLAVAVAMVTTQRAQRATQGASPNFDVRTSRDALAGVYMSNFSAEAAAGTTASLRSRSAGFVRLAADIAGVEIINSPELGSPEVVSAKPGSGFLTGPSADRVGTMRAFLTNYAAAYGLTDEQVASLELVADYENPAGNMAWVEFEQRVNGLPVFRGLIRGGFTASGELARTTGPLATGLDPASLPVFPNLTAAEAVSRAAANVGWDVRANRLVETAAEGGRITFARGSMAQDARAWLLYFPLAPGVARLAWATEVWGDPDVFMILVDAEDGTVLFRKNLTNYQTQTSTYGAYTADSPAPMSPSTVLPGSGGQAGFIARTVVTLIGNEGFNAFNNLGWMTDGTNTTDGNNVEAGVDLVAPDGVDGPVTGTNRIFNFAYNPETDSPTLPAFRNGEVTDVFYWTNRYHDRLYLLGFTEAARNFQHNNFGRGGAGADRVSAEEQDSSGTNNANFSTPSDGFRGRMQMYVFTGPTPDRTSGLDHDVLLHELTHGTSNRLHSNASGLNTTMSGGMGEGWSDFYARAILSGADEDPNGIFAAGGWVTNQIVSGFTDNYYYGIRRFPYAVKTNVGANGKPHSPLTFADIDSTQINTTDGAFPRGPIGSSTAFQVHNIGEIWCMALLEVRARFIARLGYDAGNQRILQFVTDGMKLDPANPTLLQGRDAILAAAAAGGGTAADRADIWAGFATRGMGLSASITNASTGLVVEAFDKPGLSAAGTTLVTESMSTNGRLDPGETVTMSTCVTNEGDVASGSMTGTLLATGGVTSPSGAQVYGAIGPNTTVCKNFTFTVGLTCGSTVTATLQIAETGLPTRNLTYTRLVGTEAPYFSQNFDGVQEPQLPVGWTTSTLTGTANPWMTNIGLPDTAPNRAFARDFGTTSDSVLVSPTIAVPAGLSRLTFRHLYSTELPWDGGVLEISINGAAFTDIIAAGGAFLTGGYVGILNSSPNPLALRNAWTGSSAGFVTTTVTMPAASAGQNVALRWRMGSDNLIGGVGWAVDSITLSSIDCTGFAPVIVGHPQSQTILNGHTALLSVTVTGTPVSYQWYQGVSPSTATPIAGATAATYRTPALTTTTMYWVQVTNGSGLANSNTATITTSGHATYDSILKAPRCRSVESFCDSDGLLDGRDTITSGPEPNQPNTINNTCTDGTTGTYHVAESIDRIKVSTLDSTNFEPGKTVKIDATVFVTSTVNDRLDLYYTANAAVANPVWTLIATLTPVATGVQVLTQNYVLPVGNVQAVRGTFRSGGAESNGCVTGTLDDHDHLIFPVNPAVGTELITNGNFSAGITGWSVFEVPDIVHNSGAGGVLAFHKAEPTTTNSGQAVVYQNTSLPVAGVSPLVAQFDLGNNDTVRKRITVLVVDGDFSDHYVCTFWVPASQTTLKTYKVNTHPSRGWANVSIYFFAASIGLGDYLLDNVSLKPTGAVNSRTECVDPNAPPPPGGPPGPNLIVNGDFSTAAVGAPWLLHGDITQQVAAGVFEFIRPGTPGAPAGVLLQKTGAAMSAGQIMTSTFQLGNSSSVRKRVTVLLHDVDFTDLQACTFWMLPGQPLATYTMRIAASKAWTNATWSVYGATIGPEQWMRLDNVTLARTPASTALGTECLEGAPGIVEQTSAVALPPILPGSGSGSTGGGHASTPPAGGGEKTPGSLGSGGFTPAGDLPLDGTGEGWIVEAWTSGLSVLGWAQPIDLTSAANAELRFDSFLSPGPSSGDVQASVDGVTWQTMATAPRTGDWTTMDVDLGEFIGQTILIRFVYDGVAPGPGVAPGVWKIGNVIVQISSGT